MTDPMRYETEQPNAYRWTEKAYAALTNRTMRADVDGADGSRRAKVTGPCPRCGHEIHFDQLLDAVAGEDGTLNTLGRTVDAVLPAYLELVVSCRCGEAHPGRPEGTTSGCGINFRADILDAP